MCDICVMTAVKDRMISRLKFFKTAAAVGAAAAVGVTKTTPAMAA